MTEFALLQKPWIEDLHHDLLSLVTTTTNSSSCEDDLCSNSQYSQFYSTLSSGCLRQVLENGQQVDALIILQDFRHTILKFHYFWYLSNDSKRYYQCLDYLCVSGYEGGAGGGVLGLQPGGLYTLYGKPFQVAEVYITETVKLLIPALHHNDKKGKDGEAEVLPLWLSDIRRDPKDWIATSHNSPGRLEEAIEDKANILALIIFQDSNVGGTYFRYFWYIAGQESKRFSAISSAWKFNTESLVAGEKDVPSLRTNHFYSIGDMSFRVVENEGGDNMRLLYPVTLPRKKSSLITPVDLAAPWLRDLHGDLRSLIASGRNVSASFDDFIGRDAPIAALIIFQDCNMFGTYFRYFWYLANDDDGKRYVDIESEWKLSDSDGDVGVPGLQEGKVYHLHNNTKGFHVLDSRSDYVKLLVPC
eukprot:scaffold2865_cov160-Ochromonas_danica.AAC.5